MDRKETIKINFRKTALEGLQPPIKDRYYAHDTKLPGLCIMVTALGQKRFYVYKRIHGVPKRLPGGTFPTTSVEAARSWAKVEIGRIEQGADPLAERQSARNQVAFGLAWEDYKEKHLKPHRKPKSLREFQRIYDVHLTAWASRSLATISTGDVAALHVGIGQKNGHHMANRVLEVAKAVINYARHKMDWKHPNPCEGITRFNEDQRERVLDEEEGKRLREALDSETDTDLRDYVELLLETAQRRGNVENMQWSHLDLVNGRWLIPGSEFKNGRPQNMGLTEHALSILKSRKGADLVYVFANRDFRPGWERLREVAELVGFTRHDLRRSVGSTLAATGASEAVIAKVLGHRSTRSTSVYTRIADKRAKQALEGISGAILGPSKRKASKRKAKKAG